jgi:hypothetical protein
MPNAPLNEIHPFNVGVKRQNSNTPAVPKTTEPVKNSLSSKRSKSSSSKSNSKKSKQHTGGGGVGGVEEDDELMPPEAYNSNEGELKPLLNEQAGGESSSELDLANIRMEENPAAIESSRTDSIDSTSSMLNQNVESVRDSLNSLSNTPTNNTPSQHFNQND